MTSSPLTLQTKFALDVFVLDAQARNLSPRTVRFYRQQISYFLGFLDLQSCHTLDQITPHHIRQYLRYLQYERSWKSASVHSAARAIRAFLNFCTAEEMLHSNPMARVKMPKTTQELQPAFTEAEIRALLAATDTQRDRALLLCLLDTGCRAGEFVAWNVGDINLPTGTVRVRYTKNRTERTVYLGTRARRELMRLYATQPLGPDEPVWRTLDKGTRLTYHGLQSLLQKLGQRAAVRPCSPHRFRRTFALMSLRNGMNVYALQRIMGHSDLSVLRRYLALVDDDLQEAHRHYGAVDKLFAR
ncbi:MAG: tyrosine-type recombinase/integrase [Caldilineaceae bacterium]|nr:tyrosine-type recombinase/integrase [Caldilineaceae bacterium]